MFSRPSRVPSIGTVNSLSLQSIKNVSLIPISLYEQDDLNSRVLTHKYTSQKPTGFNMSPVRFCLKMPSLQVFFCCSVIKIESNTDNYGRRVRSIVDVIPFTVYKHNVKSTLQLQLLLYHQ